jgi:hypothetical protein
MVLEFSQWLSPKSHPTLSHYYFFVYGWGGGEHLDVTNFDWGHIATSKKLTSKFSTLWYMSGE